VPHGHKTRCHPQNRKYCPVASSAVWFLRYQRVAYRQTDGQTDRHTDRQSDRQTDRQTDRTTDKLITIPRTLLRPTTRNVFIYNYYSAPGTGAKCCNEYVCLSVCSSDCMFARATRKPHGWTLPNLFCMLPVAVAQISSDGVAMRYVLPVYGWSCFHIMGPIGRIKQGVTFRRSSPDGGSIPVGRQTTMFGWGHQNVAPGTKPAIYDLFVITVLPSIRYIRPVPVIINQIGQWWLSLLLSDLVESCFGEDLFASDVTQQLTNRSVRWRVAVYWQPLQHTITTTRRYLLNLCIFTYSQQITQQSMRWEQCVTLSQQIKLNQINFINEMFFLIF